MTFFLPDAEHAALVFVKDYARSNRQRCSTLPVHGTYLGFHAVSDCLFVAAPTQALLPVQKGETLPFIFLESCPYKGNEAQLTAIARTALQTMHDENFEILDEAVPLCPPGAENLWHWMSESLPKIVALEQAGYTGMYIVPHNSTVADQTLALLEIAPERIVRGNIPYRVKRLVVPDRLSGFSLIEDMPLCGMVRNRLCEAVGILEGSKRCYIRRIGRRKVSNEDALLSVLQSFDFEIMTPEDLTLAQQLRYMTNAECSVMAHGANSTLALMQKKGSTHMELFGNRYVSYNNLHAVRLLGLRYHSVVEDLDMSCCPVAPMQVQEYFAQGNAHDIFVDVNHVYILLESALRQS